MKLSEWRIRTRLIVLTAIAVLGLAALGLDSLNDLRSNMLQDRTDRTRLFVEVAGGVIARFHDLSTSGVLSEDEQKNRRPIRSGACATATVSISSSSMRKTTS
jgi:hypothetical protein